MRTNIILELSMVLDRNDFQMVFDTVNDRSDSISECEDGYIDGSLADKGIVVRFRDSTYKKKIFVIVNVDVLLGSGTVAPDKLAVKLDKKLSKYFGNEYGLESFVLSEVSIFTDINVGDNASAYIAVLKKIGRVKGFTPTKFENIQSGTSYCLAGNSNGIDFLIYDLQSQLADDLNDKKRKQLRGLLRIEVKLTKKRAVSAVTHESNITRQIKAIVQNSNRIFTEVFSHIVPFGGFYKLDKATESIADKVSDSKMKRRMLSLVRLIPQKRSLLLAQKALNYRRVDDVMAEFSKINLSPVTIGKREEVKELRSLYEFLK